MLQKISITICFLLLAVPFVYADPIITGVSSTLAHNGTITISGSGFGIKNPAAPLVWDDCTDNPPLNTYYDCYLPTNAQQGSQYNTAYHSTTFRSIGGPHSRVNYVLAGAHATNSSSGQYASGNNVMVGKNMTSFQYFANYWYRVDPNYDEENHPSYGDNMKELDLSETAGGAYGGSFGYWGWCTSHVPDINFTGQPKISKMPTGVPDLPYKCSINQYTVYHNSPINGWIKMQWEGDYNDTDNNPTAVLTTYPDGHVTDKSYFGTDMTTENIYVEGEGGYPKSGNLEMVSIGGFSRVPRYNNGVNSFRYFAGVYIDNTRSRVVLGNNPNYSSCTKMEPQIPSLWSNTSIQCSANLGEFPDSGTAYLFVFDSDNNRNTTGYEVTLGVGDDEPPDPPTGLRIVGATTTTTSPATTTVSTTTTTVSGSGSTLLMGTLADFSSDGKTGPTRWKACMYTAVASGTATRVKLRIANAGNVTSGACGYAIYSNNGLSGNSAWPDGRLASGYVENYNFTAIGPGIHEFPLTGSCEIISGNVYWIGCNLSSENITWEKDVGEDISKQKRGYVCPAGSHDDPPDGDDYNTKYGNMDRYSWSAW